MFMPVLLPYFNRIRGKECCLLNFQNRNVNLNLKAMQRSWGNGNADLNNPPAGCGSVAVQKPL